MKVRQTQKKGKGVFAEKRYAKGAMIMRHEILIIPDEESKKIQKTYLDNYAFMMGEIYFLALGRGSLLNHSTNPNVYYIFRKKKQRIEFYTQRAIKKGDELTIDYGWGSYPWEKN